MKYHPCHMCGLSIDSQQLEWVENPKRPGYAYFMCPKCAEKVRNETSQNQSLPAGRPSQDS